MQAENAQDSVISPVVPESVRTEPADTFEVLVVGDWFVDEHWRVGKHRAPSSSRTGREHSRALHRETCSVRSLCGAGQVATILAEAHMSGWKPFRINGIGIWHLDDGTILKHMLRPGFNKGRTPHRLAYEEAGSEADDPNVNLYTLTPRDLGVVAGTTRIIRTYRHVGDQIELDQRIDWELPLTDVDKKAIQKGIPKSLKDLRSKKKTIKHILVKDLGKGVVKEDLIEWLVKNFKDASWYVSSKTWRPDWLEKLPKNHVKLLLIPQLAAQNAIDTGKISSSSWVTAAGVPSRAAMESIDDFVKEFGSAQIVVLPEGMSVLGREGNDCYVYPSTNADVYPYTPMASVFFPALASHLIARRLDLFHALKKAVAFTTIWKRAEAQRMAGEGWVPTPDQILSLDSPASSEEAQGWREKLDWKALESQWEQAFSDFGIVTIPNKSEKRDSNEKEKKEFHLWRAMTDIQGYVTCIPSKREHVLTLLREARSIRQASADEIRSKSFFIVDQPGSGKTFLVDRLASSLGMPCLKFNISALSKREDLHDCFQRISAAQSEHSHSTQIVFFDEMNARREGHVYDAFLGPLEDGTYFHNGRTFHLKPCFWIFAGTEPPVKGEIEEHLSDKGLDFESRLSHPVMYLNGEGGSDAQKLTKAELDRLRRLEQVYIGVATIRAVFPDVTKVSTGVLEAFHLADPANAGLPDSAKGPRGIRRFVRSFQFVQYGEVTSNNLPKGWHRTMGIGEELFHRWLKDESKKSEAREVWVEIRTKAED